MNAKPVHWMTAVLIISLLVSCSNQSAAITDPDSGQVRALTAEEARLVSSGDAFGLNLFRQSSEAKTGTNLVVSPLSVAMALAMTYNGAEGSTREAMQKALQFDGMSDEQINRSFQTLIKLLTGLDSNVTVAIANSIWSREGFAVKDSFLSVNRDFFGARVSPLDFSSAGAADIINSWVSDQTRGKIPSIVESPLDPQLMMLLINAVYFKGTWTYRFDSTATSDRPFYLADGSQENIPFMKLHASVGFTRNKTFSAVDLPYGDGDYSMTLILPAAGQSVDSIVASLTTESWRRLVGGFNNGTCNVFLPRFTVTCSLTLNDVLSALGMGVAFDPSKADFRGISDAGDLAISQVLHKTYVAVDEAGTEAAAATSVGIILTSVGPHEFTIMFDHPFIFAIREKNTGSLLFLGRIMDPAGH